MSEVEYEVHNGEVLNDVPGVKTDYAPPSSEVQPIQRQVPQSAEDVEPEALASLMAGCITAMLATEPKPTPMAIVTELLKLKTPHGHKAVWTRFDMLQLFALWTNKQDNRPRR